MWPTGYGYGKLTNLVTDDDLVDLQRKLCSGAWLGGTALKTSVFDRMANAEGFCRADIEHFLAGVCENSSGEIGAVFGYMLGRLDSDDALAMVQALRGMQDQREIPTEVGQPSVSMVGTGGGASTFNITTTASFIVAAAGPLVVKMGSNSWRSKSGSADVAALLGVMPIRMPWDAVVQAAEQAGIVFCASCVLPTYLGKAIACYDDANVS